MRVATWLDGGNGHCCEGNAGRMGSWGMGGFDCTKVVLVDGVDIKDISLDISTRPITYEELNVRTDG